MANAARNAHGTICGPDELRRRTKQFALRVISLFRALPRTEEARVLGRQLLRSATGMAANYRSACRCRSRADFISKIGITLEEADETVFWLELLVDSATVKEERAAELLNEANELVRIFAAPRSTAASRREIADHKLQITNC
ncbi:MAG TPA: four helix bundle protein [Terriglobia bacterium]|nr:four helix bundle protein [Terriglobia bacterium]